MPKVSTLQELFDGRYLPDPNSGCWIWTGPVDHHGYGRIWYGGRRSKNVGAHRASLILAGVEVPADHVVMHKCDNPICVNPDHLKVGTQRDNIADMHSKGRAASRLGLRFKKRPEAIQRGADHPNFGNRKTHCKHGHELSGHNIIVASDGHRRCRICRNRSALAGYHSKKGNSNAA